MSSALAALPVFSVEGSTMISTGILLLPAGPSHTKPPLTDLGLSRLPGLDQLPLQSLFQLNLLGNLPWIRRSELGVTLEPLTDHLDTGLDLELGGEGRGGEGRGRVRLVANILDHVPLPACPSAQWLSPYGQTSGHSEQD